MVYYVFTRKQDLETGSRMIYAMHGEPKELYSRSSNHRKGKPPTPFPRACDQHGANLRPAAEWPRGGASVVRCPSFEILYQPVTRVISILLPQGPRPKTTQGSEFCRQIISPPNPRGIFPSFAGQSLTPFQLKGQQHLSLNTQPASACVKGEAGNGRTAKALLDAVPGIKGAEEASVSQAVKLRSNSTYFKELS